MPIYEYKCSDCGQTSEFLVGIGRNSDDLACRSCGGSRLEPLLSAPATVMGSQSSDYTAGSTCCGANPSTQGCTPGRCCGSN
ncbi:MAG: FmdB family zinc ribbon protein [Desulfomonilaceae bacterium]